MRNPGSSFPCSSLAPCLHQMSYWGLGMMQPLSSWSCQSLPEGRPVFNRSFMDAFYNIRWPSLPRGDKERLAGSDPRNEERLGK